MDDLHQAPERAKRQLRTVIQARVFCNWLCTALLNVYCAAATYKIIAMLMLLVMRVRVGHGLDSSMDWIGLDWVRSFVRFIVFPKTEASSSSVFFR